MKNPIAMTREYPEEVIEKVASYSRFIGIVLLATAFLILRTPDSLFLWFLAVSLAALLWVTYRAGRGQSIPRFMVNVLVTVEGFFIEEARNNEIYRKNEDKASKRLGVYPISEEEDEDGWEKFPETPDDGKWRV